MQLTLGSILKTYDDLSEPGVSVEYKIAIHEDGVTFELVDDHLVSPTGELTPAEWHRSVKIELRADGTIGVLLFATNDDEPLYMNLNKDGTIVQAPT